MDKCSEITDRLAKMNPYSEINTIEAYNTSLAKELFEFLQDRGIATLHVAVITELKVGKDIQMINFVTIIIFLVSCREKC